jgi:hypothetical protein
MTEQKRNSKAGRPSRTLEQEIAAAGQRLLQLKSKKREEDKRELERNQKAILALLRSAGLDAIAADTWQAVLPKLTELLTGDKKGKPQKAASGQEKPIAANSAPAESAASVANA